MNDRRHPHTTTTTRRQRARAHASSALRSADGWRRQHGMCRAGWLVGSSAHRAFYPLLSRRSPGCGRRETWNKSAEVARGPVESLTTEPLSERLRAFSKGAGAAAGANASAPPPPVFATKPGAVSFDRPSRGLSNRPAAWSAPSAQGGSVASRPTRRRASALGLP